VVDELAGAGELVKGKRDQVPVAVIRGYLNTAGPVDGPGAAVLVRNAEQDLFSLGTAEARASGLRAAATLAEAAPTGADGTGVDPAAVDRAIATVAGVVAPGTLFSPVTHDEVRDRLAGTVPDWPAGATSMVLCTPPDDTAATGPVAGTLVRFGADLHRLRAALAAEGVPSSVTAPPAGSSAAAALAL
jgi:coenzyme F420-0:L-glutamate ligase/coenzyme F420-1:gamma-L-glutamate ligase